MQITVVAIVCYTALAEPGAPADCHEEIALQVDSLQSCMLSQPGVAEWQEKTIYRGPRWTVRGYRCMPGNYVPRVPT
jgi:hypothetical protein